MQHSDFVSAWKAGKLEVDVERSKAVEVVAAPGVLPERDRKAYLVSTLVWILTVPAALAVMYFYAWWAGLIVLLLVTPALGAATKKSVMRITIDRAVADNAFYDYAIDNGIIRVREKG